MRTQFGNGVWRRIISGDTSDRALATALWIAERLRDPAHVESIAAKAATQSEHARWSPHSLSAGYSGTAILAGHLDRCFPNCGWDRVAHEHMVIASSALGIARTKSIGLFSGISGLGFSAHYLSRNGERYTRLLATLDRSLEKQTAPLIGYLDSLDDGVPVHSIDLISGISGAVPYLIHRSNSDKASFLLDRVVACLVSLLRTHRELPRWHTPAHLLNPADSMSRQFPHGHMNCGLAHGIPGPLGALSLAQSSDGLDLDLRSAIDQTANWLAEQRCDDHWGVNWPSGVGLSPINAKQYVVQKPDPRNIPQSGWCYGSPGVARSLYLAGRATRSQATRDLAVDAIKAVVSRPWKERRLVSPTFCHGFAGLLQIILRFSADEPSLDIAEAANDITERLLSCFDQNSPLGFKSIGLTGVQVDSPGLLDGAAGIALVLLAASVEIEPAWDRAFMLS